MKRNYFRTITCEISDLWQVSQEIKVRLQEGYCLLVYSDRLGEKFKSSKLNRARLAYRKVRYVIKATQKVVRIGYDMRSD